MNEKESSNKNDNEKKNIIISTEIKKGMGFGNMLFCYVSTIAIAKKSGMDYAIFGAELLNKNLYAKKAQDGQIEKEKNTNREISEQDSINKKEDKGYFINLDIGKGSMDGAATKSYVYKEQDERIYTPTSMHDITNGCYIAGVDERLLSGEFLRDFDLVQNNEIKDEYIFIEGNLQASEYLKDVKDEICNLLSVKKEYEYFEYAKDNICVINIRGGEYAGDPSLFVRRKYFKDAMKYMKKIRPDMEFIIVTDDINAAKRVIPNVKAVHEDIACDYTIIKNAHHLILSNTSFAFFAAYTNTNVKSSKDIIAPKYWARHNVSNGYWASEQNIYDEFTYIDRKGKAFSAKECRGELQKLKKKDAFAKYKEKPEGLKLKAYMLNVRLIKTKSMAERAFLSLARRSNAIFK